MGDQGGRIDRRSFLGRTASLAGGATLATTALSYSRIVGANDRISLGHIGVGNRGRGLAEIAAALKDEPQRGDDRRLRPVDGQPRDARRAPPRRSTGARRASFQHFEDLLALKDVDAVLISTPEHSHSPILKRAVEAGKDAYVEKPMGNVLEEARAARDATRASGRIVQVGTQHRSEPYPRAARELVKERRPRRRQQGRGGVELPRAAVARAARGRPDPRGGHGLAAWLMTKPARPFDPRLYFEFRLYREFSSGIPDQWMSHGIDLVHWFMEDSFPRSVVAHGGVFAWPDGRENPDTFHALLEYPKGFLVSYSTSFGNDSPGFTRYMGKKATLVNLGGEGSPRYQLVEEKGTHEDDPGVDRQRAVEGRASAGPRPRSRRWASTT